MNGYTTAENNCTGCMGPCGQCQEFLTEQAHITHELQKMDDMELEAEKANLVSEFGRFFLRVMLRNESSAIDIGMLKKDISNAIDHLAAINQEIQRRVIP